MDIIAINDAIETLKNADTTVKNMQELANLYIVRDNLEKCVFDAVESEFDDISQKYQKYCKIKRDFQLGEVSEEAVIKSMQTLCREIQEFIQTLYSHTDSRKERKQILALLEFLYKKYNE